MKFVDKRGNEHDTIVFDAYCVAGRRLEGLDIKVRVSDEGEILCGLHDEDLENLTQKTKVKPDTLLDAAEGYVAVCLSRKDFTDFTGEGSQTLIDSVTYDNGKPYGVNQEVPRGPESDRRGMRF